MSNAQHLNNIKLQFASETLNCLSDMIGSIIDAINSDLIVGTTIENDTKSRITLFLNKLDNTIVDGGIQGTSGYFTYDDTTKIITITFGIDSKNKDIIILDLCTINLTDGETILEALNLATNYDVTPSDTIYDDLQTLKALNISFCRCIEQINSIRTVEKETNKDEICDPCITFTSITVDDSKQNTIVADYAGCTFVAASNYNTVFGYKALNPATTGDNNVAIGPNSLLNNTTGTDNIAVGRSVLEANTIGIQNTAIGTNTLKLNIDTSDNTAVGYNALQVNIADNNTAFGSESLEANTTGTENTAIGVSSMLANITGSRNTVLGSNTVCTNVNDCIVLGQDAASTHNTAIVIGKGATSAGANTCVVKPIRYVADPGNEVGTIRQLLWNQTTNEIIATDFSSGLA